MLPYISQRGDTMGPPPLMTFVKPFSSRYSFALGRGATGGVWGRESPRLSHLQPASLPFRPLTFCPRPPPPQCVMMGVAFPSTSRSAGISSKGTLFPSLLQAVGCSRRVCRKGRFTILPGRRMMLPAGLTKIDGARPHSLSRRGARHWSHSSTREVAFAPRVARINNHNPTCVGLNKGR